MHSHTHTFYTGCETETASMLTHSSAACWTVWQETAPQSTILHTTLNLYLNDLLTGMQ